LYHPIPTARFQSLKSPAIPTPNQPIHASMMTIVDYSETSLCSLRLHGVIFDDRIIFILHSTNVWWINVRHEVSFAVSLRNFLNWTQFIYYTQRKTYFMLYNNPQNVL
jgi:hypothetical protein